MSKTLLPTQDTQTHFKIYRKRSEFTNTKTREIPYKYNAAGKGTCRILCQKFEKPY